MANDIQVARSAVIKNGTAVVYADKLGNTKTLDTYVSNKPAIADIEAKYDERFDDPTYYTA